MLIYIEHFADWSENVTVNPCFISFGSFKWNIHQRINEYNSLTEEDKRRLTSPMKVVNWKIVITWNNYIVRKEIIWW